MHSLLLDTGALVALLDRSEKTHKDCVEFLKQFRGDIFTTEPVLTEALYLLGPSVENQKTCISFILQGGTSLVPQSPDSLARAIRLMEKYNDIPMDFADATLVVLAEEAGIDDIFTLDYRGFRAYRIRGKKEFKIWPKSL
ncbi:MAG: PIN domain-containing protein [Thermodesulfovibrionales bacterium]|nr:PIN domain-containing protein [Thermodesulfovibrionales bacterium]